MGKPQKYIQTQQQVSKKTKKRAQRNNNAQSQEQQVQDLMAWGRKKQNYYRDDEQQYSSLSQEQNQAKKIYENKYDNYMNNEQLYDIPVEQKDQEQIKDLDDIQSDQQARLPTEYVDNELEWVLELFKDCEYYEDNQLLLVYKDLLKSYLVAIISIKQLEIPYIQYHPIISLTADIKTKIDKLMMKLTVKEYNENQLNFDDQVDEDSLIQSKNYTLDTCKKALTTQSNEHRKALEFYNQTKKQQQKQKKVKKVQRKQQRYLAKKPAFKQIKQNQSRFASELILKNKGLIKKRKKIQGNSRVKLRKKFEKKKAIHRAKSGHFIRENPGRSYEGQANIKTGKLSGVRLK